MLLNNNILAPDGAIFMFFLDSFKETGDNVNMILSNLTRKKKERRYNMKNGKFKNLIIDAYNKYKEGNLVGILYGAISTYGFSDLKDIDIECFLTECNLDMLHLKSRLTDTEIEIYASELEDYKVKSSESTIYIKLKNKSEIGLMY